MPEPVASYKYFDVFAEPKDLYRKTYRYRICTRRDEDIIGWIEWYGPWRQFCLCAEANTVWSAGCLQDVQDFIRKHAGKGAE